MIVTQLRTYLVDKTISRLYVDGAEQHGACLEDVGRGRGVKIQDETCIPEGVYFAKVTYSPTFKKNLILLYNNPADFSVVDGVVKWTGIRVHAGTKTSHTAGCVLYQDYQQLQDMIVAEAATGKPVMWIIERKP